MRLSEPYGADARVDLTALPTFTIDPDDAQDFDDAISARRENGRIRVWVHIADVTAYLRPGRPARARGVQTRNERVCARLPSRCSPRRSLTAPARCARGRRGSGLRSRWSLRGRGREHGLPPLADPQRQAADLRRGGRTFAGRASAAAPWGEPLAAAREAAAALRAKRDALELGAPEPVFEGTSTATSRGCLRAADRVALPDRAADDPGQRASGRLPGGPQAPTLYRVHERPEPTAVGIPGGALASLDIPTPPLPRNMTPQQAADLSAEISRIVARKSKGVARMGSLSCALAQARFLQRGTRPRRAGQPALLPLHLADPPYPDVVAHRALLSGLGIDHTAASTELDEAGMLELRGRARRDAGRARRGRHLPSPSCSSACSPTPTRRARPSSRARSWA